MDASNVAAECFSDLTIYMGHLNWATSNNMQLQHYFEHDVTALQHYSVRYPKYIVSLARWYTLYNEFFCHALRHMRCWDTVLHGACTQ